MGYYFLVYRDEKYIIFWLFKEMHAKNLWQSFFNMFKVGARERTSELVRATTSDEVSLFVKSRIDLGD